MFTFHYKVNSLEVTIKTDEAAVGEIADAFKSFLLAVGFHPDTVASVLPDTE